MIQYLTNDLRLMLNAGPSAKTDGDHVYELIIKEKDRLLARQLLKEHSHEKGRSPFDQYTNYMVDWFVRNPTHPYIFTSIRFIRLIRNNLWKYSAVHRNDFRLGRFIKGFFRHRDQNQDQYIRYDKHHRALRSNNVHSYAHSNGRGYSSGISYE